MDRSVSRRAVIVGSLTALAGCVGAPGSTDEGGDTTTTERSTASTTTSTSTTTTQSSSGTVPLAQGQLPIPYSFEKLRDEVRTGAAQDGIPSIDEPSFVDAENAELEPEDVVFGIAEGDTVKAYPQNILVWHEIVNDTVDGTPLAVSYCPLTGTVLGFERGTTTFGVSGKLVNNNLVMYDRATESWWSQILGTSFKGPHEGESLRERPLVWTRWGKWRETHPETRVLSRETGYIRNYDNDPYGDYTPKSGYYTDSSTLYGTLGDDDRFDRKHVVVGARGPAGIAAVEKQTVAEETLLTAGAYLAVWDSDLQAVYLYHNPDERTFEHDGGMFSGPSGSYPGRNLPLDRAMAFDAMWFAWSGFYPDTTVHS